ncbi:MAG: NAD(P)H-hydrate dehydratase [bacterium]|nr:NAD(P)H-hydrate dehydratase [bacterium]
MRVCTSRQMSAIDAATIETGISGEELMERAGRALTESLLKFIERRRIPAGPVVIICGKGNNGGDGLVMARLLHQKGHPVELLMVADRAELKGDAAANYDRLPDQVDVLHPAPEHWAAAMGPLLQGAQIVVDAVFGTGITPPVRKTYISIFKAINNSSVPVVSVDIPSGVDGDHGSVEPLAIKADLTVTVGLPKRGLLMPPGRDYVGQLEVVDIGFPPDICQAHSPSHFYLTREEYRALLLKRPSNGHKYDFGRVCLFAGSRTYGGAAHLAGLGALRSGVGLVTMAVPLELKSGLLAGLPETVVSGLATTENGTIEPLPQPVQEHLLHNQQAVVLGPGLDADEATDSWVVNFAQSLDLPLILDADGLSAFARKGVDPVFSSGKTLLTPHAGELARLCGLSAAEVNEQKLKLVPDLAQRWNVVLMLKGSPAIIASPDGKLYFNPSGDDALARGGSGDVLSGLLGGLLAQGMAPLEAALLGAYLHGLAGCQAAAGQSTRSVLVRETAAALGPVFQALENHSGKINSR